MSSVRENGVLVPVLGWRASSAALESFLESHPTHAQHVALAVVLGGIEENTTRETWRFPQPDTSWYFQALAAWNYPLTSVEKLAAGISA